jgi:hypothetical protein
MVVSIASLRIVLYITGNRIVLLTLICPGVPKEAICKRIVERCVSVSTTETVRKTRIVRMTSSEKKIPLAKLGDGRILCTSEYQDRYFIVYMDGHADKVSLQAASKLYVQAEANGQGNLLWKRSRKQEKAPEKPGDYEERTRKWRAQMEKALGRSSTDDAR